jgi:hypothetical protein
MQGNRPAFQGDRGVAAELQSAVTSKLKQEGAGSLPFTHVSAGEMSPCPECDRWSLVGASLCPAQPPTLRVEAVQGVGVRVAAWQ